jgi:hypothetical protein
MGRKGFDSRISIAGEEPPRKGMHMRDNHSVADMADEVLAQQTKARASRTGESFEEALDAILKTEAGRQLWKLRNGPHRNEAADEWQEGIARERAEERDDALGWRLRREASDSSTYR